MEDPNVGDPLLTIPSRQDELLDALPEDLQEALADIANKQTQQADFQKSILEELRLLRVSYGIPRSVWIVATFLKGPYRGALYEVKLNQGGGGVTHEPPLLEPVCMFFDDLQIPKCTFIQSARIFSPSNSKLYLLPEIGVSRSSWRSPSSFQGYIFDTETRSLAPFSAPIKSKPVGTVVSAYGKLYYLASPACFPKIPKPSFERYDPAQKKWEKMPSFPFYSREKASMHIVGYAVCYGVILFSMFDFKQSQSQVIAFHEGRGKWDVVEVDTSSYVPFKGRGVVVGKTIYALSQLAEEIIAFSYRMDEGDDGGIAYFLSSPSALSDLKIASPPFEFCKLETEYLVHLGNQKFCHVKTGRNDECGDRQHLCVTTFQIFGGGSYMIENLHSTVYAVDVKEFGFLSVKFSFASECNDFEPPERKQRSQNKKQSAREMQSRDTNRRTCF